MCFVRGHFGVCHIINFWQFHLNKSTNSSTPRAMSNFFEYSRHCARILLYNSFLSKSVLILSWKHLTSSDGHKNCSSSLGTSSLTPPTSEATKGTPEAIASNITCWEPSSREGIKNTSAARKSSGISLFGTLPSSFTWALAAGFSRPAYSPAGELLSPCL